MWHLEKAILEQFNTSENVSCVSLNDANTHFQTKLLVSTVTLFRFGRNPNENLFSGVQIVLIPVVCCRADEAVVSKQKQECEKETKEKHGAKQNMRMACIDVPVENTFFQHSSFPWLPADEWQNPKKYKIQQHQQWIDWSRLFLASSAEVGKMSAGSEKTESGVWSGCARPHLFTL